MELNHQMRLEEVERNICQQNETFIKELSSAKEKVPHTAVVRFIRLNFQLVKQSPTDSSVGRAVDCRGVWKSIGRWFESGSVDSFLLFSARAKRM